MSFKYTSRHHGWYAAQVSHGTTYVVLTLSLLIRPVWPSTCVELVSLSKKKQKKDIADDSFGTKLQPLQSHPNGNCSAIVHMLGVPNIFSLHFLFCR